MNEERDSIPGQNPVTLRTMTAVDVPFAMELKNAAGWNQAATDWLGYLEFEPDGCFVAEAGGRAVGTATSIRYGECFGWIGMVLVHSASRRLGIGTTLLRHVIGYLQQRGTRCVKLDATPMGRNVYVPLGFRDEYEISRFEGTAPAVSGGSGRSSIVPWRESDLDVVAEFDAAIFGAERRHVLKSMSGRNREFCFVSWDKASVGGYLIAREGWSALQIGPWCARDVSTAEALLAAFFARVRGRRILVDVPHPNAAGCELMRSSGFGVQRGFTRMFLGENRYPGIPVHVFGTSSAEKG